MTKKILIMIWLVAAPTQGFHAFGSELGRGLLPGEKQTHIAIETRDGTRPPVNRMLELLVRVDPRPAPSRRAGLQIDFFDARMPEHNHGMIVKPAIKRLQDNTYLVSGVKFHMPGNWQLRLQGQWHGQKIDVSFPIVLP